MRILISNDDGVSAPGIQALAQALATFAHVEVVAPDRNRSAASNSLTITRPLRIHQLDNGYYSVDGTPTDCVHLALKGFIPKPMDLVVSGINEGANLGDDVLYSGTVAAAMEGRYLGLPSIAVSLVGDNLQHYDTAAKLTQQLIKKLSQNTLPAQTILNVNIPNLPIGQIKGFRVTRLGTRHSAENLIQEQDPRGKTIYWIAPPGPEADAGPGTDFHAVSQGYVSVTPLNLNMTYHAVFDTLSECLSRVEYSP